VGREGGEGRVGGGRLALAALALFASAQIDVQAQVPGRVADAAARAGITAPIAAWCQGQFRANQRGYAVAAGGKYLALDGAAAPVELAAFSDKPDLSCYSRSQARELHREIQRSDTLSGSIVPRFDAAVICGFVDATTAMCWQYSPTERQYVEVGGWST
jgi:hypothetical protein